MKLPEELQFIENGRMHQKTTRARVDGKVCVISGATSGLGYEAAKQLARNGAQLVLVCRNHAKALKVLLEFGHKYGTKSEIVLADFTELAQVRHAAEEIAYKYPKINILINNAGMFNTRRKLTQDGNEMTFQVIHLGSFLLTKMLEPNLIAGAPARVLDINSEGHRFGGLNIKDLNWRRRPYMDLRAYGAAKTAQLLTLMEFAERLKGTGVTINAMHPGAVRTNIGMNNGLLYRFYNRYILWWFLKEPQMAGKEIYYLAAAPQLMDVSGKFFNRTIEEKPAAYVLKQELIHKMWELSEQLTGLKK
jgi:retinol dehydrogenase 13